MFQRTKVVPRSHGLSWISHGVNVDRGDFLQNLEQVGGCVVPAMEHEVHNYLNYLLPPFDGLCNMSPCYYCPFSIDNRYCTRPNVGSSLSEVRLPVVSFSSFCPDRTITSILSLLI